MHESPDPSQNERHGSPSMGARSSIGHGTISFLPATRRFSRMSTGILSTMPVVRAAFLFSWTGGPGGPIDQLSLARCRGWGERQMASETGGKHIVGRRRRVGLNKKGLRSDHENRFFRRRLTQGLLRTTAQLGCGTALPKLLRPWKTNTHRRSATTAVASVHSPAPKTPPRWSYGIMTHLGGGDERVGDRGHLICRVPSFPA
jgi:hypothetical protein